MRSYLRPFLPGLLVAGLLLAGCGTTADELPDDTETVADDPDDESPTGKTPAEEAPAEDDRATDDEPTTPDEDPTELFGFVVEVAADGSTISFDEATWVSDDAEPNGYRIENSDRTARRLAVAADADIHVLTATGDPTTETTVDGAGLASWFAGLGSHEDAVFDVTVDDGVVTAMAFRYRP